MFFTNILLNKGNTINNNTKKIFTQNYNNGEDNNGFISGDTWGA